MQWILLQDYHLHQALLNILNHLVMSLVQRRDVVNEVLVEVRADRTDPISLVTAARFVFVTFSILTSIDSLIIALVAVL